MPGTLTPGSPSAAHNGASISVPPGPPPATDQELFDAAVNRDGRIAYQILIGVAVFSALVMSTVALVLSAGRSNTGATTVHPTAVAAATPAAPAVAPVISLSVAGSSKMGPDGKMHDAYTKTDFAVRVGQPTKLRINNTDDVNHSITSAATGVNITVLPGVHTYTVMATKAGRFEWMCVIPCDSDAKGWAMTHPGYMAGYITAA
jgi:heme/copper-type cytochrome/quinol oxidase subunit 2